MRLFSNFSYYSAFLKIKSFKFFEYLIILCFTVWSSFGFAQSKSVLDSLKIDYHQETNDSLKIIKGIDLSRAYHKSKYPQNLEYVYAEEAVEQALKLNDTLLFARALDNLGLLYRFHQQYEQSFEFHSRAASLIENQNVEPYYQMRFTNNAGVAARYLQKYAESIFHFMEGLKIAEQEKDLRNIAISSNGIGNALVKIAGREDEALPYFERALQTEESRDNPLGMAINYLAISDYYIKKNQYSTARSYLDELLQLNKKINDERGLAMTYQSLGELYLKEGKDLERATTYFMNALNRFKLLKNQHKEAEILFNLGNIQLKLNNNQQAEVYFSSSMKLADQLKQNELLRDNSLKLYGIYQSRARYKEALYYYKLSETYEDSIKLAEQNIRIEALTRKYNFEKKENQIALLEKDKILQKSVMESQTEQLHRRKITMTLLIIGIVLLLVVFFLQYRNYKTRKLALARIQKEEKEKMNAIYERNMAQSEILVTRLRVNPHFLFNCLTAITYLMQSEQNAKAIKYLKIFSRFTRMVLETSDQNVISLEAELKLTKDYLMLEENRFEDGFVYRIEGEDCVEISKAVIPPLLLQPFIENAIWHGLLPSKSDDKILSIEIIPSYDQIKIIIEDNGVGRIPKEDKNHLKSHKSMGMQIIKERINLYNQSHLEKIELEIVDKTDNDGNALGTKVIISLPQQ